MNLRRQSRKVRQAICFPQICPFLSASNMRSNLFRTLSNLEPRQAGTGPPRSPSEAHLNPRLDAEVPTLALPFLLVMVTACYPFLPRGSLALKMTSVSD